MEVAAEEIPPGKNSGSEGFSRRLAQCELTLQHGCVPVSTHMELDEHSAALGACYLGERGREGDPLQPPAQTTHNALCKLTPGRMQAGRDGRLSPCNPVGVELGTGC